MESQFEKIDNTKFGWLHVKAILVAGIGFFCDAYDLFIINLVVPMIGYAYYSDTGAVAARPQVFLKGSAVIGTFFGQLIFGILGDMWGRKSVYGISLLFMVIGAVLSAMSASAVRGMTVIFALSFWRFILGIGIGGDYPLSAVITSEYATVHTRGMMISAVFAMQGIGQLTAAVVSLIVIACFKDAINEDRHNVDYVWRICLGLGTFPAVLGAYYRAKLPETPRYTAIIKGDALQAQKDIDTVLGNESNTNSAVSNSDDSSSIASSVEMSTAKLERAKAMPVERASIQDFIEHYKQWKYFKVIFGCAMSWFMLDVAFYGLGLNQSIILTEIGYTAKKTETYNYLFTLAAGNCLINLMGSVPGYYVSVALIERMGRTKIQIIGFASLTVIFVILSALYYPIKERAIGLFIFIYCLGQFMFNFGPNTTTFVIPGEVFPTKYRSTSHGICAATGKLGAVVSSYGFTYLVNKWDNGVQILLGIFSIFMFLGFCVSWLIPETKGISLEELNEETTPASK